MRTRAVKRRARHSTIAAQSKHLSNVIRLCLYVALEPRTPLRCRERNVRRKRGTPISGLLAFRLLTLCSGAQNNAQPLTVDCIREAMSGDTEGIGRWGFFRQALFWVKSSQWS
ncbi:unnamed protein product [Ectocarpus sp. 12 AP-2014]